MSLDYCAGELRLYVDTQFTGNYRDRVDITGAIPRQNGFILFLQPENFNIIWNMNMIEETYFH